MHHVFCLEFPLSDIAATESIKGNDLRNEGIHCRRGITMKAAFLIGRFIFGGFFVYNGLNHLMRKEGLSQHAAAKNLPQPEAAVIGSGIAMMAGGTSIILGLQPKLGAAAIIAFLATASPLFHDFWNAQDPAIRQNEMAHFMKNLALLGAALTLLGLEEWPVSVCA
jgi:putative oxidoreductase